MKFFLIIFIMANISISHSFETWVHRTQEYGSPQFEYTKNCKKMEKEEIESTFNFEFLENDKFTGIEIDVVFNEKINDLVVYHGSKLSKGPHEDFQCFKGRYLIFKDFIGHIKKFEKPFKVWIDLKNSDSGNIEKAAFRIKQVQNHDRFIVETQSYFGAYYLKSQGLKTSLWLKIRGPIEDSFSGKLRMFRNKMRVKAAEFLGVDRISQSCGKMIEFKEIFNNDYPKMCWNTSGKVVTKAELTKIQGLTVVLDTP